MFGKKGAALHTAEPMNQDSLFLLRASFLAANIAGFKIPPGSVHAAADRPKKVIQFVFQRRPVGRALRFQLIDARLSGNDLLIQLTDERQYFFFLERNRMNPRLFSSLPVFLSTRLLQPSLLYNNLLLP
jgi:hypothetical protein